MSESVAEPADPRGPRAGAARTCPKTQARRVAALGSMWRGHTRGHARTYGTLYFQWFWLGVARTQSIVLIQAFCQKLCKHARQHVRYAHARQAVGVKHEEQPLKVAPPGLWRQ